MLSPKRQTVYCAFCRTRHEVYTEKSLKFRHFIMAGAFSICLSFAIWGNYNPKSLLFAVISVMIAEIFCRLRWRMHLVCRACGFDPVIYKNSPSQAAELVKAFLKRRSEDPQFLLKKPLNLPKKALEPTSVERKSLSTSI
jgi:hypothetical protein